MSNEFKAIDPAERNKKVLLYYGLFFFMTISAVVFSYWYYVANQELNPQEEVIANHSFRYVSPGVTQLEALDQLKDTFINGGPLLSDNEAEGALEEISLLKAENDKYHEFLIMVSVTAVLGLAFSFFRGSFFSPVVILGFTFLLSFFGGQFYKDISFVKGDFERVSNIDTITPGVLGLNSSTFRDAKCFQKLGLKKYSAYRFELGSACDRLDVIRNVGAQVIGIKATSGGLSDDPLFFLALYTISPGLYDNARSYFYENNLKMTSENYELHKDAINKRSMNELIFEHAKRAHENHQKLNETKQAD